VARAVADVLGELHLYSNSVSTGISPLAQRTFLGGHS
jgi:hypothetical protein